MKLFYLFIILFFLSSCSFDNKTGIWKNDTLSGLKDEKNSFSEFKSISSKNNSFNKIIQLNENFKFQLSSPRNHSKWTDIYLKKSNNYENFIYNKNNNLIYKSKRVTKNKVQKYLLYKDENVIITDIKGNLIIFSTKENKIIKKFNFYKKKYKKKEKFLNLILINNTIYVADNIGYLYAYDYIKNKILWAKNYKIPFRSNLKISNNTLIASNQNNDLLFFNIENGNIIKTIPTEETLVKNEFINNLSLSENSLFFLNTYGSLYSVDLDKLQINWFLNLTQFLNSQVNNLFSSNQVVYHKGKIIVNTNQFTYVLDSETGSIIHKKNFSSYLNPLIIDDYLFLVSKNNLLISMSISTGKIIYSYNINQLIAEFFNSKEKTVNLKNIFITNNELFIILKNSFFLSLDLEGKLNSVNKLPTNIASNAIIVENSLMYLDNKYRISRID
tara:strand:+ start:1500 stop:2828 length:1329 start_codon:yes stop_codon:yes gene_type:complete